MKAQESAQNQKKIFENQQDKKLFQKGLKFLAGSLPLLFGSPIIVTIGFKALNKGNGPLLLILGCVLTIFTIALVTQAFRLILKSLFHK